MKKIGDILKELRKSKGKTQEEIANEMNTLFNIKINKGMISKWESNKSEPVFKYVKLFSNYYNVSVDFLLGLDNVKSYELKTEITNVLKLAIKDYKENRTFYENISQCNEESLKKFTDYLYSTFDNELKCLGDNFTSRTILELYVYVNKILSFELNKITSKLNTNNEITATIDNVTTVDFNSNNKDDDEEVFVPYKSLDEIDGCNAAHADDLTDEEKAIADQIILDDINEERFKEWKKKHNK